MYQGYLTKRIDALQATARRVGRCRRSSQGVVAAAGGRRATADGKTVALLAQGPVVQHRRLVVGVHVGWREQGRHCGGCAESTVHTMAVCVVKVRVEVSNLVRCACSRRSFGGGLAVIRDDVHARADGRRGFYRHGIRYCCHLRSVHADREITAVSGGSGIASLQSVVADACGGEVYMI